ncbi:hypothetical protein [Natronosalvus amylolyticus]|uniref:hypothetical protein n=1 Tax=Natronosalvus amylolyticus TaxID=2961994 RepID=UPI0020C969D9|nr:hypothetical protein [Natronosalvus amylolyticus]
MDTTACARQHRGPADFQQITLTIDNIEEIANGRNLSKVVELFDEALGDSDIAYVEYWQNNQELVMNVPSNTQVNEPTIAFILAKMERADIVREVNSTLDSDLLCVRFVDNR